MEYQQELSNWDFRDLKAELATRIVENHTIDQERVRITRLLNKVFATSGEKQ